VTLDGSGSVDPEGEPLVYLWEGPFVASPTMGAAPTVAFDEPDEFTINLEVSDGLETARCSSTVRIEDTMPPEITAPADITRECTSPAGSMIDDLGIPIASDICDSSLTIASDPPAVFPLGSTTVIWQAYDDSGLTDSVTQIVTVTDTTPPEIGLTLSPSVLWPPNHKMVQITPVITVSDICDASPMVALTSITMNEGEETSTYDPLFDDIIGDGHTSDDIKIDDAGNIYLRAERSGAGGGRIYTITYTATDASGRSAAATPLM